MLLQILESADWQASWNQKQKHGMVLADSRAQSYLLVAMASAAHIMMALTRLPSPNACRAWNTTYMNVGNVRPC
jgi:hypothetical protein